MRNQTWLWAIGAALISMVAARPAGAQTFFGSPPPVSVRPFFLVSGQRFAATETFETVFGGAVQPFWGGGVEIAAANGFFFDFTISRFRNTGDRAFFFEGEGFSLGLPMTVTVIPIEFTAGARFSPESRVTPYAGGGIGTYAYEEVSEFAEPFEERHIGYIGVGGVEFRLTRWLAIGADAQYTYVPDIIGSGGVSQDAGEDNLGGIAARFRFLVGR
jgi:hypothetical protein